MNDLNFEKKWLETENGKLCYFSSNKFENKPTVIFLHGLSANHTTWDKPMEDLEKIGINSLAPDLRGHGYSDKTRTRSLYEYPVFTNDLELLIKKEKLDKIILVGYSFGGFIALDYVRINPDKVAALILISTNHVNPWKYKTINLLTWPAYYTINLLAWLFIWQSRKKYYYYNQKKDLGYWRSTLKGITTMPVSINLWMLSEAARVDFSESLEKITCPTLILKSRADHLVSEEEIKDMSDKIKPSKTLVFDETSHYLASRHQEIILQAMTDFLKEEKII
jgi:esterase